MKSSSDKTPIHGFTRQTFTEAICAPGPALSAGGTKMPLSARPAPGCPPRSPGREQREGGTPPSTHRVPGPGARVCERASHRDEWTSQ